MSLFLLAAAMTSAAAAQSASPLERCIAARTEQLDFSGVVSVVQANRSTTVTRGFLDGPGSPEISAGSRFNLGSAGKMFTAVAVAQLVGAGKVGLDDAIGRHVDGLAPQTAAVTVRQLMTHSSGLSANSWNSVSSLDARRASYQMWPGASHALPPIPVAARKNALFGMPEL